MSIEQLKTEVLRLDPKDRAYLAREILASLENMDQKEIENLWVDEAVRRDENLDAGIEYAHPADEVIARIRARRP